MTGKGNLGPCQVKGCNEKAKYATNRIDSKGNKEWLHVCKKHEGLIARENLKRAGYYNGKKSKGG